jgi:hypothetical protein
LEEADLCYVAIHFWWYSFGAIGGCNSQVQQLAKILAFLCEVMGRIHVRCKISLHHTFENPLCCVFIPFINLNVEIILGGGG